MTAHDSPSRYTLRLPELGLGSEPITSGLWLVGRRAWVAEGDSLLEIVAPGVVVDLPSPASGVVQRRLVGEDEPLTQGQALAVLEIDPDTAFDCGAR